MNESDTREVEDALENFVVGCSVVVAAVVCAVSAASAAILYALGRLP